MIISRTLAKRAIAQGQRPAWLAAWGPVLADAVIVTGLLSLLFMPVMTAIYAAQPSNGATFLLLFAVFFVPFQAVMILSSLWAAKSRWSDEPTRSIQSDDPQTKANP